jgi:hypothetical protein
MPPVFMRTVKLDPGPEFLQLQVDIDRIRVCHFRCPWVTQIFASFDNQNFRRYLEHGLRDIRRGKKFLFSAISVALHLSKFSMRILPAWESENEEAADEKYGENGHRKLRWIIQESP